MSKAKSPELELSFRLPMQVTQMCLLRSGDAYPLCPQCRISLEREYQRFCDRCGQRLDWSGYKRAQIVYMQSKEDT